MNPLNRRTSGFTLMELVVVLAVLAALAGLVLPLVDNVGVGNKSYKENCTAVSMTEVRNIILGRDVNQGYVSDVGAFPEYISDLFDNAHLSGSVKNFNINTKRGWHGPYLCPTGAKYDVDNTRGFIIDYQRYPVTPTANNNDAVMDAYSNPIVIQTRNNSTAVFNICKGPDNVANTADDIDYAQLVSAGVDGILGNADDEIVPLRRVKVR